MKKTDRELLEMLSPETGRLLALGNTLSEIFNSVVVDGRWTQCVTRKDCLVLGMLIERSDDTVII